MENPGRNPEGDGLLPTIQKLSTIIDLDQRPEYFKIEKMKIEQRE